MEDKKKVISVDQAKLYVKLESQNKKESVNFKTKQGCCNGRVNPVDENQAHPRLPNNRELTRSKKRRLRKQKIVPSSVPSLPRTEDLDPPRNSSSVRLRDSSVARSDKDHDAPEAAEAKADLTKPCKNILNNKKTNEVLNKYDSDRNAPHGTIVKKEVEENTMPTSGKGSRTGEKKRDETAVEREAKNKKKTENGAEEVRREPVEEEKSGEAGRKESTEAKSREEVIAERELRKKTKKEAGGGKGKPLLGAEGEEKSSPGDPRPDEKTKAQLRAERRAKQEAQRAAKEAEKQQKGRKEKSIDPAKPPDVSKLKEPVPKEKKSVLSPKPNLSRVKLFSHLQYKTPPIDTEMKLNVHPAIVGLGAKYAARVVNGSNARCLAFLQAMKQMITDYITPPEKEFSRGLETQIGPAMIYLHQFRPQPVSVTNALRHIKSHLTQLPNNVSDDEARAKLCEVIDTYIREQVHVAALAISKTMQRKIANGDVILTYACSSLLCQLLVESKREGTEFSVVVVDAGPWFEGREMLRRLTEQGIDCSYVLINALSFIMRKATTVLIGAHALLANGCVMSRAGSSLVALMAHSCNVPVLVCCETHKFSERVQTDAFVYNEFGDPDDIAGEGSSLSEWRSFPSLSPLNLLYDITPPDLVTAVVTELAILPCTSVPVVLRVKPSDLAN